MATLSKKDYISCECTYTCENVYKYVYICIYIYIYYAYVYEFV